MDGDYDIFAPSYEYGLCYSEALDGSAVSNSSDENPVELALTDTHTLWGNALDSQRWQELIALQGLRKNIR